MRFAKFVVGWICFLSIVFVFLSLGLWAYITAAPFLHGARIDFLPFAEPGSIRSMSAGGAMRYSDVTLERFVAGRVQPQRMLNGTDAIPDALEQGFLRSLPTGMPPASGYRRAAAVVVMDMQGRVVDATPKRIIGLSFPVGIEAGVMGVSAGPNVSTFHLDMIYAPAWTRVFENAVRRHAPNASDTRLFLVRDSRKKNLGYLAISQNGDRRVLVPASDGYITPRWLSDLARPFGAPEFRDLPWRVVGAFLLYLVLLPLWVALDAGWRGTRPYAWGLLIALTNLIGLAAYLLGRPKAPGLCRNCGERVLSKYVRCPGCGVSLLPKCPKCGVRMRPGWQFCPVCRDAPATPVEPAEPTEQETVRQPVEEPVRKPMEQKVAEPTKPAVEPIRIPETGSLEIIVTDASTRSAAPSASISLSGPSPREGMTNARGVFEARKLEPGSYTATASKPGHATATSEIEIYEGEHETVRLGIMPLSAAIWGQVLDGVSRRPIVGASVYLDTTRIDRYVTTGQDGEFELAGIPSGPYTVGVEAEGYSPQTRLVELSPGEDAEMGFALTATVKIAIEQ